MFVCVRMCVYLRFSSLESITYRLCSNSMLNSFSSQLEMYNVELLISIEKTFLDCQTSTQHWSIMHSNNYRNLITYFHILIRRGVALFLSVCSLRFHFHSWRCCLCSLFSSLSTERYIYASKLSASLFSTSFSWFWCTSGCFLSFLISPRGKL